MNPIAKNIIRQAPSSIRHLLARLLAAHPPRSQRRARTPHRLHGALLRRSIPAIPLRLPAAHSVPHIHPRPPADPSVRQPQPFSLPHTILQPAVHPHRHSPTLASLHLRNPFNPLPPAIPPQHALPRRIGPLAPRHLHILLPLLPQRRVPPVPLRPHVHLHPLPAPSLSLPPSALLRRRPLRAPGPCPPTQQLADHRPRP